ncbi:hypothetical protein WN943_015952 [Citrus x changshan-huyou]
MAALPPDIIVDVFANLPAKSLCRSKCLSKSFRALITNPRNDEAVVAVHVFSLRNNTWNTLETDFKFFHHCSRATNLNGTVHFGFCKLNSDYMIAAFDLAKDKFKFLALPDNALQPLCSMKDSDFILSVLDEKFVLIDPKDGKKYEDFMIDGFQENVRKYNVRYMLRA